MKLFQVEPVAHVENSEKKRKDENWGCVISTIRLLDCYKGSLLGLADFSHAIIVTYLHQAKFSIDDHLQRHPRNLESMPLLGIFSQRGKNRPNPIGITSVEILSVEEDSLIVSGLDAINGTPVLDIKPYFPQYDRLEAPRVPEWVFRLMKKYF